MAADNPRKVQESGRSSDHVAMGLMLAMLGFAGLSVGDAIIKSIAGAWPGTAVSLLRYVIGTAGLLVALLIVEGKQGLRCPMPWIQLARGVTISLGSVCFFSAIFLMPLADATAIQFTSPMFAALFSALILRERMPLVAWIATLVAFVGVLMVLRPNFATLGWAALLPMGTAIGMSLNMILNRMVSQAGSALLMQLLVSAIAIPVLAVATAFGHFSGIEALHVTVPDWTIVARIAVVACTATVALMLIYLATTKASAAVTAPMTYVQILVALGLGMLFYQDYPDPLALGGAALIIAAGLWLWSRQRVPPAR
ncbi:DMT family transporter [Parasphingopyxis marina]|uniref:DMT family transporter n=1 Tax=Parasphingopyxis marina TaxID=2761622 RepID=A0A842I0R9_9SPHN|nr:DMT family transporter [Parasphingopyxis marina]MBC2777354.1 DMT family transporter [Parasphingopyxis marina]